MYQKLLWFFVQLRRLCTDSQNSLFYSERKKICSKYSYKIERLRMNPLCPYPHNNSVYTYWVSFFSLVWVHGSRCQLLLGRSVERKIVRMCFWISLTSSYYFILSLALKEYIFFLLKLTIGNLNPLFLQRYSVLLIDIVYWFQI